MQNQKGFTLIELFIILYTLGAITFVCGVGYVLYHFISKIW